MNKSLLIVAFLAAHAALAAGWEAVQRISPDLKVRVELRDGKQIGARFVSASETELVVRSKTGEQSLSKPDILAVRVADPAWRMKRGLIATGAGAALGLALGFAICPGCANEGDGAKFTLPAAAGCSGLGAALGFLPPAYRTLYEVK